MKITNRLKEILDALGLYNYQPTDALLNSTLGGMTRKRFFQILANKGQQELELQEIDLLEAWLKKVFNRHPDDLKLVDPEVKKALQILAK